MGAYFHPEGPIGAEISAANGSGCYCFSYFQIDVRDKSEDLLLQGRGHCIAIIVKKLPCNHFYICDPDAGVYRFKTGDDVLRFMRITFKRKTKKAPSGSVTGVNRLRLVEVAKYHW